MLAGPDRAQCFAVTTTAIHQRIADELGVRDGQVSAAVELLDGPTLGPQATAAGYVDPEKGVADVAAALDGARAILVERFAEDADLIGTLRGRMWTKGRITSKVRDGRQDEGAKFADYFDFA